MINNQIKEGRDSSIDMAKGILIAMLIFHHIVDVCAQLDVSNIVISAMRSIQKQMIVCYFMPAFFMITGICSNFNKPFVPFVKNQIKSLLIPAVSFILLFHIYQGDTIRQLGKKAALTIKPKTPASAVFPYLDKVDMILVMTVEPGFGGQSFMSDCAEKIKYIRENSTNKDLRVEVDGGINAETGKICKDYGADTLVAGSYVYGNSDITAAIQSLR